MIALLTGFRGARMRAGIAINVTFTTVPWLVKAFCPFGIDSLFTVITDTQIGSYCFPLRRPDLEDI